MNAGSSTFCDDWSNQRWLASHPIMMDQCMDTLMMSMITREQHEMHGDMMLKPLTLSVHWPADFVQCMQSKHETNPSNRWATQSCRHDWAADSRGNHNHQRTCRRLRWLSQGSLAWWAQARPVKPKLIVIWHCGKKIDPKNFEQLWRLDEVELVMFETPAKMTPHCCFERLHKCSSAWLTDIGKLLPGQAATVNLSPEVMAINPAITCQTQSMVTNGCPVGTSYTIVMCVAAMLCVDWQHSNIQAGFPPHSSIRTFKQVLTTYSQSHDITCAAIHKIASETLLSWDTLVTRVFTAITSSTQLLAPAVGDSRYKLVSFHCGSNIIFCWDLVCKGGFPHKLTGVFQTVWHVHHIDISLQGDSCNCGFQVALSVLLP